MTLHHNEQAPVEDRESLPCSPPPSWTPNGARPQLSPPPAGGALALLRELWGPDRIPEITPEGERRVDELIERARRDIASYARGVA